MHPRPIYLDHHATTPVDPRVAAAVLRAMTEAFGNANSRDHAYGDEAAGLVDAAAADVAALVGAAPADVVFTGGATEAVRLALADALARKRRTGARGALRVVASAVEHDAVRDALSAMAQEGTAHVRWVGVDARARLDVDEVARACAGGTDLLCAMAANNEVGTLYPVEHLAAAAAAAGADILVDATQAAGRVPLDVVRWGVTYLVLSAHKMYGPKGSGALVSPEAGRRGVAPGAGHAGTPNVPGVVGLGEACRLRRAEMAADEPRVAALRDRLEARLREAVPGLAVNGDRAARLSHNLHVAAPGAPNDAVLARLRHSVAVSSGAACASGAFAPSHVLRAMGVPGWVEDGALRVGLGKWTTEGEVELAAAHVAGAIAAVRSALG